MELTGKRILVTGTNGFLGQLLFEELIKKVNDLRPKRDYIYIDDLVEALVLSVEGSPGIYNVGSGYSVSVEEVIQEVLGILGSDKSYQDKGIERPNEIFELYADISRIRSAFGWEPGTSIQEGIRRCIESNR
ncbi:MAG: NAD-dependent epimerase/dehydratase family protein [Bacteroidetes bacterium]|nr:MAG: NAD-dependent epimerase/dehydratase family protein [Bacteroidota bacterium]